MKILERPADFLVLQQTNYFCMPYIWTHTKAEYVLEKMKWKL